MNALMLRILWCGIALALLTSCGGATKEDTLEKALGQPDDIGKFGPMEKWTSP